MLCKPDKLRYCIDTLLTITNLPCPCMYLAKLKITAHFRTTTLCRMFGCVSDFPGFELTLLNKRLRLEISLVCICFLRATVTVCMFTCDLSQNTSRVCVSLFGDFRVSRSFSKSSFYPRFLRNSHCYLICIIIISTVLCRS